MNDYPFTSLVTLTLVGLDLVLASRVSTARFNFSNSGQPSAAQPQGRIHARWDGDTRSFSRSSSEHWLSVNYINHIGLMTLRTLVALAGARHLTARIRGANALFIELGFSRRCAVALSV